MRRVSFFMVISEFYLSAVSYRSIFVSIFLTSTRSLLSMPFSSASSLIRELMRAIAFDSADMVRSGPASFVSFFASRVSPYISFD